MPCVRPPMISKEARDPKGLQESFQQQEYLVLAPAKDIRQDLSGPVINGMPQPARLFLLAHKALPFSDLGVLDPVDTDFYVAGAQCVHEWGVDGREGRSFFFNS